MEVNWRYLIVSEWDDQSLGLLRFQFDRDGACLRPPPAKSNPGHDDQCERIRNPAAFSSPLCDAIRKGGVSINRTLSRSQQMLGNGSQFIAPQSLRK
jgi:hypothetical protein